MIDTRNLARGERHPGWRGDDVSYHALHHWIRKYKAKPPDCQHCGRTDKPLDWANISKTYKRDLADWIALCQKCHRAYDRAAECRNGHLRTPENTTVDSRGIKKCRPCKNASRRRVYYRNLGRPVPV